MNPLTDLIPAAARKYVYGVVALAALVFSIYQASEGDWGVFVGSLLAALVNALALSNTFSPESDVAVAVATGEVDAPIEDQVVGVENEDTLDGHVPQI